MAATSSGVITGLVGSSVTRVEDQRILRGKGRYIDDIKLPGMLHAAFLRSPHAHARITRIDTAKAKQLPGVVAVLTAADLQGVANPMALAPAPDHKTPSFTALCTDKVRLVGDLVALVVAESRYLAEDACQLIEVDYDPLPPIATIAHALDPSRPPLFDEAGDNVAYTSSASAGDLDGAFAHADRVIKETFSQHRYANVPMETRGAVASFNQATGELLYHGAVQAPQVVRFFLATLLNVPVHRVRVINGDIGGAFGLKAGVYREDVALAAASKILGRPVKWIEDRVEHLLASGHAREETAEVEAAVKNDGTLLGLKVSLTLDQGAYPLLPFAAFLFAQLARVHMPGPYRLQNFRFDIKTVFSNKATYVPYRGPWAVETWVRERLIDVIARELGLDPVEVRRTNLITREEQPVKMATGPTLEGVTARETLERALTHFDYAAFREEQRRARAQGRLLGLGIATFIEFAPGPPDFWAALGMGAFPEQARVRIETDGNVTLITGQAPHGQGHETTLAQVVGQELGVPYTAVRVIHGDTQVTPFSAIGTGGSRGAALGSGPALYATRKVKDKVKRIAAAFLEVSPDDLEIAAGMISARGAPQKAMPLGQVAGAAYFAPNMLPAGEEMGLEETHTMDSVKGGWANGTHCVWVEVDPDTGQVKILRYLAVEDCGTLINPAIVDGQVRGAIAQGIGGVLYERAAYDEEGQMQAATFMDYLLPTASEVPEIEIDHLESPPLDEVNFRGIGEGGAILAPAALTNAIEDALAHLGVKVREQYLPPSRILELLGTIPIEA